MISSRLGPHACSSLSKVQAVRQLSGKPVKVTGARTRHRVTCRRGAASTATTNPAKAPTAIPSPLDPTTTSNNNSENEPADAANAMPMRLTNVLITAPTYLKFLVKAPVNAAARPNAVPPESAAGASPQSSQKTGKMPKMESAHMMPPIDPVRSRGRATTSLATQIPAASPNTPDPKMSPRSSAIANSTPSAVPVQRIIKTALARARRNLIPRECRTAGGLPSGR